LTVGRIIGEEFAGSPEEAYSASPKASFAGDVMPVVVPLLVQSLFIRRPI
jgi:hypothetical protein